MYMRILNVLMSIVLLSVYAVVSVAQEDEISLPVLLGGNKILILGESYGNRESSEFLTEKVSEYVNTSRCLKVGLEITSDQQELLDSALKGGAEVSEIIIDEKIDHAAYREMLDDFSKLIKEGKCLSVYAIAPPTSSPMNKDSWMEQKITQMMADGTPVVVLVDNPRAVKKANVSKSESAKLLSQRLRSKAFGVSSILQRWKPDDCDERTVELIRSSDKNSSIQIKEALGEYRAVIPDNMTAVTDGVLVWGCKRQEVQIQEKVAGGKVTDESIAISQEEVEVVARDEETLKRIRAGIKHNYPVKGMTIDEATEAMGEPNEKKVVGNKQEWVYECFNDDGFYYDCFVLRFQDEVLIKYLDLQ